MNHKDLSKSMILTENSLIHIKLDKLRVGYIFLSQFTCIFANICKMWRIILFSPEISFYNSPMPCNDL